MNEGIFGDAFSQPDMGMGGYINPIAQTDLQRIGRLPMRASQQQPQDNTAALLGLLSMGRGALGGSSGTGASTAPGDPTTNALPGLIGMTSIPAAVMSYLYRSGLFERGAANLGNKVITPIANFGGSASPGGQLTGIAGHIFGDSSADPARNTSNIALRTLTNLRGLAQMGPSGIAQIRANHGSSSRADLLSAGATPEELDSWGF